jgi:TPR repeat protein
MAMEWFKCAAENGMIGSAATLARMFDEGLGVEKNPEEAQKWYKQAGF